MSFFELLESSPKIFGVMGLILLVVTLIAFTFNLSLKFRLTGVTIFSFLLSLSSWAFLQSYSENIKVEGAIYAPIVYDNGSDLIIAKADNNFPIDAVAPTLEQISKNLKRGSRSGRNVTIRIRSIEKISEGVSKPIILGEIKKSFINQTEENND